MCHFDYSWWRHQMETFSALLANCAGNSTVPGEFPAQKPVTQSFDVFCLRLNKRLSKQSRGWWFETPSRSLWRHCKNSFSSLSRGQTNVKVKIPNDYHICIIRQIHITLHHDLSFWNKIYLKFSQKYLSCKKPRYALWSPTSGLAVQGLIKYCESKLKVSFVVHQKCLAFLRIYKEVWALEQTPIYVQNTKYLWPAVYP